MQLKWNQLSFDQKLEQLIAMSMLAEHYLELTRKLHSGQILTEGDQKQMKDIFERINSL